MRGSSDPQGGYRRRLRRGGLTRGWWERVVLVLNMTCLHVACEWLGLTPTHALARSLCLLSVRCVAVVAISTTPIARTWQVVFSFTALGLYQTTARRPLQYPTTDRSLTVRSAADHTDTGPLTRHEPDLMP